MYLVLVEAADVVRRHAQRFDEIIAHGGERFVDLRLRHQQAVQFGVVEFAGIVAQGGVAAGAHVGNDAVDDRFHVGLGADVAVEDVLRGDGVKRKDTDHKASASFILVSSSVSWRVLNL